jgi:DNA-binding response OmpR family regulator
MNCGSIPGAARQPARVLVVASDPQLIEDVRVALDTAHVEIRNTTDGLQAAILVADWKPHIAIADSDLAQTEMVGDLVSIDADIPLIALTRATSVARKLRAFRDGADDVLVVPFATQELLARFTAVVRRAQMGQNQTGVLRVDDLEINVLRRRATLCGADLRLTPVEQSLLYLLATNAGRVLSRDQILDAIWGKQFSADSNLVDRHIRNLRTKLHDSRRMPHFILTVNGRGYEFAARTSSSRVLDIPESGFEG